MSIYTHSERTERKHTVGQAVASAERRLKGTPVCTNAVSGRALTEAITLQELNEIAEAIYLDSKYWAYDP